MTTFEESIFQNLAKTEKKGDPFLSSIFPELRKPQEAAQGPITPEPAPPMLSSRNEPESSGPTAQIPGLVPSHGQTFRPGQAATMSPAEAAPHVPRVETEKPQTVLEGLTEQGRALARGAVGSGQNLWASIGDLGAAVERGGQFGQEQGVQLAAPLWRGVERAGRAVRETGEKQAGYEFPQLASKTPGGPSLGEVVTESLPNFLSILAAGAAAGPVGAAGVAGANEWGAQYRGALERGATDEEARTSATLYTGAAMALESVGAMTTLKRIFPEAGEEAVKGLGARIFGAAAAEGVTEGAQEVASEAVDLAVYAGEQGFGWEDLNELFSAENLKRYGTSALVGTILSGGATAVGAPAVSKARETPEAPTPVEPPPAQPPEAPATPEVDQGLADLAKASLEIGASQEATTKAADVIEGDREGAVQTLEAVDEAGNRIGSMTFTVEKDGFRVQDVETGQRGSGGMRLMMRKASEISDGPYLGSMAETTEGEAALGRLRETDPDIFTPPPKGRGDEAGFIAQPEGLVDDVKRLATRYLAPRGGLPESAWRLKLQKDHNLADHERGALYRLREMNRKIRRYKGPLTKAQLSRYLGDALRGNVPLRINAETATFDETQIRRIAERRNLPEDTVRAEFSRAAQEGDVLQSAPEFTSLVAKLRADIDGMTRALRREGLLDDSAARELERSQGLYVHRSYEAFRGKPERYLKRVRREPLWNRAKEIIAKDYPRLTEEQVEGHLQKLIDRDERPTLPGNVPEGAKNRSVLFQRRGIRDLERLLLGERRDIRSQAMDTIIGQSSLLEHERFLQALKEDGLDTYLFERPEGEFHRPIDETVTAVPILEEEGQPGLIYRKTGSKRTDPIAKLHTSPEILRELRKEGPSPSEYPMWLKLWSMGNLAVKLNLTAGSIQTTMRNPESNIFPMLTNGYLPFGPKALSAAKTVARDLFHSSNEDLRTQLKFFRVLGVTDQGADYGDLRRLGKMADIMRVEQDPGARPVAWVKAVIRKGGELYQNGDNVAKILGFYVERDRIAEAHPEWLNEPPKSPLLRKAAPGVTRADEEAAAIVKKTLQNYSELPKFARGLSANPVIAPFFSFTWAMGRGLKNTVVQGVEEVRSDNPVTRKVGYRRLAGTLLGLSLPELLSKAFGWYSNTDNDDRTALKEFVYPWDKNANLGIVHHEPGRYVYFNWGFMDYFSKLKEPIYALHRGMTTNVPTGQIASELADDFGEEVLFSSIVDSLRGETASGWEIWMDNDTQATKAKKSIEHIWETGRPGVLRSVERLTDAARGERTTWVELLSLLGPRVVDVDVAERLNWFGGSFKRQIGEATRQYTSKARRTRASDAEGMVDSYSRANEVRVELIHELRRKIDGALQSGLTIDQVEAALLDGGLPGKYFDMALTGSEGSIGPIDYEVGEHWESREEALRKVYETHGGRQ